MPEKAFVALPIQDGSTMRVLDRSVMIEVEELERFFNGHRVDLPKAGTLSDIVLTSEMNTNG